MINKAASNPAKSHLVMYALAGLSVAVGVGSLVVFTVFLYMGSFHILDLRLGIIEVLVLDACLCLVFFLQHSGMIRTTTRRWMSQLVPERYLGAVFSVASSIILLTLVVLWQESTLVFAAADGVYRWLFRTLFFLAIAGQVWGTWALKSADLFGTSALLRGREATLSPTPMVIRGPYRWVRHPLYSTTLLMIWSYPDLTADRLLFNILFTVWIVAGTVLEERDLIAVYGDGYREYQRAVPMLIPYRRSSQFRAPQ